MTSQIADPLPNDEATPPEYRLLLAVLAFSFVPLRTTAASGTLSQTPATVALPSR